MGHINCPARVRYRRLTNPTFDSKAHPFLPLFHEPTFDLEDAMNSLDVDPLVTFPIQGPLNAPETIIGLFLDDGSDLRYETFIKFISVPLLWLAIDRSPRYIEPIAKLSD